MFSVADVQMYLRIISNSEKNVYGVIRTGQVKIPPARLPFDGDKAVRIHGTSLWNKSHAFVPLRVRKIFQEKVKICLISKYT